MTHASKGLHWGNLSSYFLVNRNVSLHFSTDKAYSDVAEVRGYMVEQERPIANYRRARISDASHVFDSDAEDTEGYDVSSR